MWKMEIGGYYGNICLIWKNLLQVSSPSERYKAGNLVLIILWGEISKIKASIMQNF